MPRTILLTVLLASIIIIGTNAPAWGAQLDAVINPNTETSKFKITHQRIVFLEYENGGELFDELQGKDWTVSGTADSADPQVQDLISRLNAKIASDGSQAGISDLNVSYDTHLKARSLSTTIDYKVVLEGELSNYVITQDSQRALVDLGWRGLSVDGEVNIGNDEINIPINILRDQEPGVYDILAGTEAEDVLNMPLIQADFILEQPLTNWHFLFDPTGINVDAGTFGLGDEIAGFVRSSWTMGESNFREGIQESEIIEATVVADQTYEIRSIIFADSATLHIIGFGALDILDGIEIAGVSPTPPEGYGTTSTGDFPIIIIYGMAGIAAVAGIGFFFVSNRSLKNELQGQQGIDPSRLVGYQTSSSSGGYQTNRGEAQLVDESNYQQTRSVYDDQPQNSPPQNTSPQPDNDAACGCAASIDMGSECDCAMQSACLCDATCGCSADICKEHSGSM